MTTTVYVLFPLEKEVKEVYIGLTALRYTLVCYFWEAACVLDGVRLIGLASGGL